MIYWSILYIKSYVCTSVEIIRSRYDVLLIPSATEGMDMVPTRFDTLQFKISEIFSR